MTLAAPLDLLKQARARFTQREIAAHVGKDIKTVRRWEKGETPCPAMLEPALRDLLHSSGRAKAGAATGDAQFRFIDLFAGIGGIRMGFEAHGGDCVFTSEWNDFSTKTYRENYPAGGEHALIGDIVSFPAEDVPSHDVLLGGFPCQPFSIAGVSKKNALGRPHGFECTTQGTLFFDVARIIAAKRPAAFLLENVKNLLSHDKGRTFDVILQTLRDELGYEVHYRVVDGQHFTPQHRERIIIVGFRGKTSFLLGRSASAGKRSAPRLDPASHGRQRTGAAVGPRSLLRPRRATRSAEVHAHPQSLDLSAELRGETSRGGKRLWLRHGLSGQRHAHTVGALSQGRLRNSGLSGRSNRGHAVSRRANARG